MNIFIELFIEKNEWKANHEKIVYLLLSSITHL